MLRRIWIIFVRDIKVNMREFITLYIMIIPLLLAVGINFISPSINDTSVNLALVEGENPEQAAYFDDFAHVLLFNDEQKVEERVRSRDDVVGAGILRNPMTFWSSHASCLHSYSFIEKNRIHFVFCTFCTKFKFFFISYFSFNFVSLRALRARLLYVR